MSEPNDQPSTTTRVPCSLEVGSYSANFTLPPDAANRFNSDLLLLMAKFAEDIEWRIEEPPATRRSRSRGPFVIARMQLLELKSRGEIPPEIDSMISWTRDEKGTLNVGKRGPMDENSTRAYEKLVQEGLIVGAVDLRQNRRSKRPSAT